MAEFPKQINVYEFVLRPVEATHDNAKMLYDIFSKDMKNLRFWVPNDDYQSALDVFVSLKMREGYTQPYLYGIYKGDEFLGEIGLTGFSGANKFAFVGYWLKESARGAGVINKLLPTIEDIAFETLDINKLKLNCNPKNIASRKIAEKNGYTLDGIMRADRVWPDGSIHDSCEYSKLRSEWEKGKQNA